MRANIDWREVRALYEAGSVAVRSLARSFGVSDTAINKHIKAERWERSPLGRPRKKRAARIGKIPLPPASEPVKTLAPAADSETLALTGRARDLVLRLLDELSTTTTHVGELDDMIFSYTAQDRDPNRRNAMLRAIGLPSRTAVLKNLSVAMKTLADTSAMAVPGGKKATAEAAAHDEATTGRYATPAPPKLAIDNTRR